MNYQLERPEKNTAVLTFTLSKEDYDNGIEAAKKMLGEDAQPEQIAQFVISQEAGKVLAEAAPKDHLKLAVEPTMVSDTNEDGSVNVTLTLTLVPEVTLPEYTGLNFEKEPVSVSDEEVLQEVMGRISNTPLWTKAPEGDKAVSGNEVILDFKGEKDGVAFEGGTAENFPLVLGSGQFIPGFEDQLIGVKAGEERDVNVTFPEDYFEPSLAGQPVIFKCKIHDIMLPVEPALDDAFVEKMGLEDVKTVEEFKAKTRSELLALKTQQGENKLAFDILSRIADGAEMDIPQAMIDSQIQQHMSQYENQLRQYGMDMDTFLHASQQTKEELISKIEPEARQELRSALVLDAIAQIEQIKADDQDIQQEYQLLSDMYKMPPEQLAMFIPSEAISGQIVQRKTLDFLKDKNTKK